MTVTADQERATADDVEQPPDDDRETAADRTESQPRTTARQWKRYGRAALVVAVYAGAFGLAGGWAGNCGTSVRWPRPGRRRSAPRSTMPRC